jgi:WD40 repeat protein
MNNDLEMYNEESGTRVLISHTKHITEMIRLDQNLVGSLAKEGHVRVWDLRTSLCNLTLTLTLAGLGKIDNDLIAIGTNEFKIRVYNFRTCSYFFSLDGHLSTTLIIIKLKNGNLASGGNDFTVRIWDFNSRVCVKVLIQTNLAAVYSLLELSNDRLAVGTDKGTINIWNLLIEKSEEKYCFTFCLNKNRKTSNK